jgi:twitching motility protein PilT
MEIPALSEKDCSNYGAELCNKEQWQTFESVGEIDLSYDIPNVCRFRVSIFKQRQGISIVIRIIPQTIPELSTLNLPNVLKDIIDNHQGLILVTGPTGSGKSTTMASMIQYLCQHRKKHIITLEDPIEYVYETTGSVINQREIGQDTQNFQNAFRASLRQDPDVILVGELRDFETISIALTAAETGHLVLGTLHTSSAASSVERIIQQDQVRTQLAGALVSVISQRLLPKRGNNGRVAVNEILINDKSVANLIRTGKTHQIENVLQTGRDKGMQSMEYSIQKALDSQLIDYTAAEILLKGD